MNPGKLGFVAVDLDNFTDEKKLAAIARILETIESTNRPTIQDFLTSMLQKYSRGDH